VKQSLEPGEGVQAAELGAAMGTCREIDLDLLVGDGLPRNAIRTRRGTIEKGCQ